MKKVAYHGTPYVDQVLREGLLASKPENAESSGEVLEVDMTGIPGDFEPGAWQGCYHGGDLEPWRLKRYVPLLEGIVVETSRDALEPKHLVAQFMAEGLPECTLAELEA